MKNGVSQKDLVSVLMTSYNREKYIAAALESVLNSSYMNFELIVVDDCSTDGTVDIVKSYASLDKRIKVYINSENLGDYPNRNKAAKYSSGKYLKYLDSDDILYPTGLEVMVSCMKVFPEAGFGLCGVGHSDRPHPVLLTPQESYYENFLLRDLFGRAPASSIIDRKAFNDVGGFSGKRQVGDHEFWLMIAKKYSMVTMPRDLTWDRTHAEQEQKYDSVIEKEAMHFDIQMQQLHHDECPLLEIDRVKSYSRLRGKQAKKFWNYAIRQRSPSKALEYRKMLSLPWRSLFEIS